MKKQQFKQKYNISDSQPSTMTRHMVSTSSLSAVATSFLEGNFGGLITVHSSISEKLDYIRICEEQTATFFRELLSFVAAEEMLRIKIDSCDGIFSICVETENHLPIDFNEANQLIRRAKDAGFNAKIENNRLTISTEYKTVNRLVVRALNVDMLYTLFRYTFFGMSSSSEEQQ